MLSGILLMVLDAVGGFFTMMLLVRTVMRALRVSFVNQIGQFTLTTTNWIVLPSQRFLPSVGRLDMSSLVPAWAIQALLVVLTVLFSGRGFGNPGMAVAGVLAIGVMELLRSALYLLMGRGDSGRGAVVGESILAVCAGGQRSHSPVSDTVPAHPAAGVGY